MERRKIWLITEASDGLGLATVKYLLSKDQPVIAIVSDTVKLNQDHLTNPLLDVLRLDANNEAQVAQVAVYVGEKYGQIDLLVNSVVETLPLTRSLLPLIQKNGQGHLIDFSSSLTPTSGASPNQMTSYVNSHSERLRQEAIDQGIKITIIKPKRFFVPLSIN